MTIGGDAIGAAAIGAGAAQSGPAPVSGRAVAPLALHLVARVIGAVAAPLRLILTNPTGRAVAPLALRAAVAGRAVAPLQFTLLPDGIQTPGAAPWRVVVRVGGVDVSHRITGRVVIDAAEDAARLADVSYRPLAGVLELPALIGAVVEIDVVLGDAPPIRRFTGVVDSPEFAPETGVVTLHCTDNLQARLDALGAEAIAALLPDACYSPAVFDPARTGWARAQDLLSTVCASLDADAHGVLRVTPWAVGAPTRTLTPASYLDGSLRPRFAEFTRMAPRVEIDVTYRYPRLKLRAVELGWQYGWTEAFAGRNGLRHLSSEMVRAALESSGWEVAQLRFDRYPSGWQREGAGIHGGYAWYDPVLCRGFSGLALRRYVQWVDERYTIVVHNPYPPAAEQPGALRASLQIMVEREAVGEWERGPAQRADAAAVLDYLPAPAPAAAFDVPVPQAAGETWLDVTDGESDGRAALQAAAQALTARAVRQIQSTLRASSVEFDIPFDPLVDLPRVLAITTDAVSAVGKVRRCRETFDHDAGTAITHVDIAVSPMQTAPGDALVWPDAPDSAVPLTPGEVSSRCGNYLGSVAGAAQISPEMVGFFTNAQPAVHPDAVFDASGAAYPEHFTLDLPEIAPPHRELRGVSIPAVEVAAGCPGGTMTMEVL